MKTPRPIVFRTALLATVALGAASGCALSVEADMPDVEVTQRGLVFGGVAAAGEASMEKSYSQQHGKLDLPAGLDSEIKTLSVTLTATGGVADLSFIHHLRITMAADGGGAPIELGSYDPRGGAAVGAEIGLTTLNPINVLDAWKTDSATFTLEIAGALPTNDWTGDVTVHFSGMAKYSY
jgi:hypothetical protein